MSDTGSDGDVPIHAVDESTLDDATKKYVESPWDESNNADVSQFGEDGMLDDEGEEEEHYHWKRSDGTRSHPQEDDAEDDANNFYTNRTSEADTLNGAEATDDESRVPFGIDDLPLFADERNKALHREIRLKEKRLQTAIGDLSETSSRVDVMTEHLKNVKQELHHTEQLNNAKQKEIESEEHMKQLAQREVGRIQQEMRRLEAESADLEGKLSTVQNYIFKGNEEMDRFKLQMNWNQDEMEQWTMAAKQKDEDAMALERYRRVDEGKIKELTIEIEKTTKALQQQKQAVEDEATETQAKQIELDKTAEEFRQLHDERQKLVRQWQETIEAMQSRDEEIAKAAEQYAIAKQHYNEKGEVLKEQKHRLNVQEKENADAQLTISAKERQQAKVQQDFQSTVAKLQEFKDQVEILKNELASAVSQLNQQRSVNGNKSQMLQTHKRELDQAKARYNSTKKILEACTSSKADAETMAKDAEMDLNAMENEVRQVEKELAGQKEQMFRQSQQLFTLRQKEAALIADISGTKSAIQNLRTKLKQLDAQTLRQQELVYNGEFQIQQMERKVSRAKGERSVEETKVLQAQIQVLQMELDRVKSEQSMLVAQCKKLEDEKRAQERVKKALQKQRDEITSKIGEIELANESCGTALKQKQKEKEEVLVQHDLQSLEVKRLQGLLNMRADEVFSLENRDFQLKKSMEERKKEISVHQDLQRARNKGLEEERHKISMELAERENRVKKLQAKFETLCKMAAYGGDDENGEERSQAYYLIKAAQRREELQREGDELDDKIRVAEKESRALKKTLEHLEDKNSQYRKSFHRADLSSDDASRMMALENQLKQAEDVFYRRKKELSRLEMDMESESNRLSEVETQKRFVKENAAQLENAHSHVEKDLSNERQKWEKVVKKWNRQLQSSGESKSYEKMILDTYDAKEVGNNLLYTLGQLANEFPEISDLLQTSVQDNGLHLPSMPPGRVAAARAAQAAMDPSLPRPMSARSDRSDRSVRSSLSNASQRSTGVGASTRMATPISKVQIGF